MNKEVYGKYINFLKIENEKKDFKIENLTNELHKLAKQKDESTVDQHFLNIPKPGEQFDGLDELTKGNYYRKVYNTLLEFKKEIEIAFEALDKMSLEYNTKMEKLRNDHKNQMEAYNKKLEVYAKRAEYQNLYLGANKVNISGYIEGQRFGG